jgi:hypothetical protein
MKIATKIGNNPELDTFIQNFCNQNEIYLGSEEKYNDRGIQRYGKDYHLFLKVDGEGDRYLAYGPDTIPDTKYVNTLEFMEAVKKNKSITVELNKSYIAVVTEENVKVGCQTFTHEVILAVAEAIKKLTKS